jgi:hypothetical protein
VRILLALALVASFVTVTLDDARQPPKPPALAGKCVGADPCHACVSCRSCKHCRDGRTCGACKPKKGERALAYFAEPVCR